MTEMNIKKLPVEKLNPAKYNPRRDLQPGDAEYEKLLRSIQEFGYVEPVIWNQRTGNIIGGHQRFKILKHLGYTEIECVIVDLDDVREKALNVALNKIGGEFDIPLLTDLLHDLEEQGFDISLTGFEDKEIDKMFRAEARVKGRIEEDDFDGDAEAAAIDAPLTRPGDVWQLGRHRLMCSDSTDMDSAQKLMGGKKARMAFTDPPWNVDYGGSAHPSWKQRTIMNDKMSQEDFFEFLADAFKSMAFCCDPGAIAYVVMSAQEWGNIMWAMQRAGYHWSSTIIWAKDAFVLSRKDYNTQYEPIWYGWLDGAPRLCPVNDDKQSDLWQIDRPRKSPDHPTMKPVALIGKALQNSSRMGDVVVDLFGGSGTTLLACEQIDRYCHTMELDPKYCDVIVKRYYQWVGKDDDIFLIRDNQKYSYNQVPVSMADLDLPFD